MGSTRHEPPRTAASAIGASILHDAADAGLAPVTAESLRCTVPVPRARRVAGPSPARHLSLLWRAAGCGRARCAISTTVGDDAADRRHRSHLGLRLRARLRHSRQGPRADAAVGVLVRAHGRHRANHLVSTDVDDFPAGAARRTRDVLRGRSMLVRKTDAAAGRVRRARLPVGLGVEGLPGHRRGLRRRAARRACANPTGCPAPIFTPATKADVRPRREHQRGRGRRGRRRATLLARAARRSRWRSTPPASAHADVVRHHPRRHQVRVRPDRRRRAAAHRRSADAGLVALLAGAISTRRAGRSRASTSSSCATTSSRSAGTSSRRCRRCPTTSCARTREKYLEAFARLTGRELETAECVSELDRIVDEMVDKGVHFDDAQREFERRFIAARGRRTATATSARPPRCSACTATPSPARSRRSRSASRAAPPRA